MKHDTFEMSGQINKNGKPYIYQYDNFLKWCSEWKGQRIIMSVEILGERSAAQVTYFKKFIIPQFTKAMNEKGNFLNEREIMGYIELECPFMRDDENGNILKIEKMTQSRLHMVIEWIKYYTAENLDYYIND